MNADELVALNEEIAGMARAGLPLDQGLAALAKEMGRGRLRAVTQALANDLRAGHTLPQALERQGSRVPPYYAGLVSAGIRTGRIGEVLATLTSYAKTVADLRAAVQEAIFYPALILLFGVGLTVFVSFYVLPQIEKIFKDFGMKLPALTELVLLIGNQPVNYLLVPLGSVVLLLLLARLGVAFMPGGRQVWARFVYSLPLVGMMLRSARLAAFTELLAILVDHETPLPVAFGLAGRAASDPVMAAAAEEIEKELNQGQPLGKVLHGRGLVPEWVAWMTGLGERRGTLGKSLHHIAEMYRRQTRTRAAMLKNVVPPFLIILLGGLFAFLFLGVVLMPLIKLFEGFLR